jgi:5-methylcytosine-specific restriction enzyme A
VGDVRPARRSGGAAVHRPLLLLWAIGQAIAGVPRLQRWSSTRDALAPVMEKYAQVEDGADAVQYPFWALLGDDLWTVSPMDRLIMTSQDRRPTLASLNRVDPLGGLREDDYQLVRSHPDVACEAAAGLLLRYFYPVPAGLLEDVGLFELLGARWADALRPLPGERFKDRDAIWRVYGGQKMAGIGCLADGILSVFSDDKGPYADGRLPDTDWIAYVGDGLTGDQQMIDGNLLLAEHQVGRHPLRYWHKPFQKQFTFETWAVVVQRRLRWGLDKDSQWRREFLWILAPVPSPLPESWPIDVVEALDSDTGELYDETTQYQPADVDPTAPASPESVQDAYRRLSTAAETSATRRGQSKQQSVVDRFMRNQSARAAVIRRSGGNCENPQCAGHPDERTTAGEPILQVDHVLDLAKGGADLPWNMIALCPNCHALKTYGANRDKLTQTLNKPRDAYTTER